jgi:hypothetical protein
MRILLYNEELDEEIVKEFVAIVERIILEETIISDYLTKNRSVNKDNDCIDIKKAIFDHRLINSAFFKKVLNGVHAWYEYLKEEEKNRKMVFNPIWVCALPDEGDKRETVAAVESFGFALEKLAKELILGRIKYKHYTNKTQEEREETIS